MLSTNNLTRGIISFLVTLINAVDVYDLISYWCTHATIMLTQL